MVQTSGPNSNTSLPHSLISELQNWEAVLKSDPEVIRKLREFDAAAAPTEAADEKPDRQKPKAVRQMQGPSL